MRIAFYAPMKPPDSDVPSGDRQMARNLIRALELAGHEVSIASRFCSRDGSGDAGRQTRLAALGERLAARLVRGGRLDPAPDAWVTYHLYHKAPDHLGPHVSAALGIPYIVAEASHAPKQAGGPWDIGYRAAARAIRRADAIVGFSSLDAACVRPLMRDPGRYRTLLPFTDTAPLAAAADARPAHRAALLDRFGWPADACVLLAVGMMRDGDKLASYRALARALENLDGIAWRLAIVGDGPARTAVETAFAAFGPDRIGYAGAVAPAALPAFYAGADLLAWPAINEAYGVALLEAQSAGLPVVAGRSGGVADIVRHGETGLLAAPGDGESFAAALAKLAADRASADAMRTAARGIFRGAHDVATAAAALDDVLAETTKRHAA